MLYAGESEFQKISVVMTSSFGRALLLDRMVVKTERDGWLYSEMMAYLPLGMVYEVRDTATPAALAEVVAYVVFAISPLLFFIF